jgi:MFS family permease
MRLWIYCLGGLVYDWLAFVFWTATPVLAERLGASATEVGLLQAASTVFYVLNSLWIGRLADRVSKSLLARLGCLGAAVACILVGRAETLLQLFAFVPVMGLAASLYWPTVQGAIGAETDPARLERALGLFNFTWSLGKTLGFALAGWMLARWGHFSTMAVAAATALPILFLYPRDVGARAAAFHEPPVEGRAAFRTMGYVANFAAFGLGAAFQNQFFKYLSAGGLGRLWGPETFFGVFLGLVFGAQTLTFSVLQRWTGWTYRRGLLYALQALGAAAAGALAFAPSDLLLLALAPLLGASLGFAYASSIHYSLHGPANHGKYAGLHEAVLGSGTVLVPLAGGLMVDLGGGLRAPYLLAGAGAAVAVLVEEVLYRRSSRS